MKLRTNPNPFKIRHIGSNVVEVWLGTPGDFESELTITISTDYIPALIAALRQLTTNK